PVSFRSALALSLQGSTGSGSLINSGGRWTGIAADPLRDLDCASRIHVFGDTRCTEAVTTNSFQDPGVGEQRSRKPV
ncbi:MAG: hypothetical protein ACHP8A_20555, partial [Terriglobales bacterium]